MAGGQEDVQPAIVIGVEELASPRYILQRGFVDPNLRTDDREHAITIVVIEGLDLLGERGDKEIGTPIVVVVPPVYPHPCVLIPFAVERSARSSTGVLELAVAEASEEIARHQVIG